ncbi:MAG: hypothetical protein ACJAYU_002134 [Bradymonadia bacterium]|jgi:hypothetical protein
MRPTLLGSGTLLTVVLAAAPAAARGGADDLQDRLEEASTSVASLETHEMADDAALEFGQARLEIAETQGKLTAGDYGWATIVLGRLEARIDLIESELEASTVSGLADQRETDLYEITVEADERQLELETVQLRRQTLQDAVGVLVEQMEAEDAQ